MAGRKRKPAALKRGKSETQEHLNKREDVEKSIRGNDNLVYKVDNLPSNAQSYYDVIVNAYKDINILSNLDIPLIKEMSYVCARLEEVENLINHDDILIPVYNKKTNEIEYYHEHSAFALQNKLFKQFTSLAGQLGMSPSSRAQIAELKMQNEQKEKDPLTNAISGVDGDDDEE